MVYEPWFAATDIVHTVVHVNKNKECMKQFQNLSSKKGANRIDILIRILSADVKADNENAESNSERHTVCPGSS